jgi:hypothetical protein
MPGETWRQIVEAGVETTWGTPVAGTRKLYPLLDGFSLTNEREGRPKRMAVNSRANVRGFTSGPDVVGGSCRIDVSSDELIEWLLITLQGGVTPTTPSGGTLARLWTFTPGGETLDSATFRYHDGANPFIVAGVYGQSLTIEGSADAENTVTVELFGKSLAPGALTGGLADRTPEYLEGWQANCYIDNFGGTAGTTAVVALLDWNIRIANNLTRKYYADNNKALNKIPIGVLEATAQLSFEASEAAALTEYGHWDTDTPRLVRLEFLGPSNGIEAGQRRFVTIDLPGHWSAPELANEGEGTREYRFTLETRYDSTNAYMAQVRAQNARAAAWAA